MSFTTATLFRLPADEPLFTMRATLAGREYVLRFDYSEREDRWYLSILTVDEIPLRRGIKVTPAVNVLASAYYKAELPQEPAVLEFVARETPGLTEFGRLCSLALVEGDASAPDTGRAFDPLFDG